jgi:hypothetical protein
MFNEEFIVLFMINSEEDVHMSYPRGSLVTVVIQKSRSRFVATCTLFFHILRTTALTKVVHFVSALY